MILCAGESLGVGGAATMGGAVVVALAAFKMVEPLLSAMSKAFMRKFNGGKENGKEPIAFTFADRSMIKNVHDICSKRTEDGRPRCYVPLSFEQQHELQIQLMRDVVNAVNSHNTNMERLTEKIIEELKRGKP